jgi:tryptophanyl-tRNA synthetase
LRILSGIQPSGTIHIGNYFGMIKKMIESQNEGELFAFFASYHALTSVKEKEVIEKISKYLKDINLKNRKLNSRKLQKLAVIVEEVSNEVSDQRNDIRLINNFLNSGDKEITGGHIVSLEDFSEDSFSSGWMNILMIFFNLFLAYSNLFRT